MNSASRSRPTPGNLYSCNVALLLFPLHNTHRRDWRLLPHRLAQAEEYGQPQEAATWDFLSLMYVHQEVSKASIAEVSVPSPDKRCSNSAVMVLSRRSPLPG